MNRPTYTAEEIAGLKEAVRKQEERRAAFQKEQAEQMAGIKEIYEAQRSKRAERAKRAAAEKKGL